VLLGTRTMHATGNQRSYAGTRSLGEDRVCVFARRPAHPPAVTRLWRDPGSFHRGAADDRNLATIGTHAWKARDTDARASARVASMQLSLLGESMASRATGSSVQPRMSVLAPRSNKHATARRYTTMRASYVRHRTVRGLRRNIKEAAHGPTSTFRRRASAGMSGGTRSPCPKRLSSLCKITLRINH
jgi:hypothetical protein